MLEEVYRVWCGCMMVLKCSVRVLKCSTMGVMEFYCGVARW